MYPACISNCFLATGRPIALKICSVASSKVTIIVFGLLQFFQNEVCQSFAKQVTYTQGMTFENVFSHPCIQPSILLSTWNGVRSVACSQTSDQILTRSHREKLVWEINATCSVCATQSCACFSHSTRFLCCCSYSLRFIYCSSRVVQNIPHVE